MRSIRVRLVRAALFALLSWSLAACGGGGGGGGDDAPAAAPNPQGLRFSIDPTYDRFVQSVSLFGPQGRQEVTLRLSRGQEMFVPLPAGDYSLLFWIRTAQGHASGDYPRRPATVLRGRVTVVPYP